MSDEDDEEVGIVAPSREIEVMLRSGGIDPMTLGDAIADGLLGSTPDSVEVSIFISDTSSLFQEQLLRFGRFYKECTLEGVWRLPDSPFRRLGLGVVAAVPTILLLLISVCRASCVTRNLELFALALQRRRRKLTSLLRFRRALGSASITSRRLVSPCPSRS